MPATYIEEGLNARGVLSRLFTRSSLAPPPNETTSPGPRNPCNRTIFNRSPWYSDGKGERTTGGNSRSRRSGAFDLELQLDRPRMIVSGGGGGGSATSYRPSPRSRPFLDGSICFDLLYPYQSDEYPDETRSLITMSRASKLTLAATGLGTAGIVYFVHWAQENDRAVCERLMGGGHFFAPLGKERGRERRSLAN